MTNLTEQWKKGKLPFGAYYVNRLEEHRIWLYSDRSQTYDNSYEIYEILERVPSYEKWKAIHEQWAVLLEENINKLKELICEFAEANQSLRKQLDEEKAKNRIDYYNGSPMDYLDECERDRKKNKIYKNWINKIREEFITSELRRTEEGNRFIVGILAKINQVLGEE